MKLFVILLVQVDVGNYMQAVLIFGVTISSVWKWFFESGI